MSFCGTHRERDRWKFMGFAMHCSGLTSRLMELYEEVFAKEKGKTPRLAKNEENGQIEMFPMPTKDREEFAKFAANLRWFLKENNGREHDKAFWAEWGKHEYSDYDFFKFFESYTDEEMKPFIEQMERIANGERLEDYKPLMDFLNRMSSRAHGISDDMRGGCF